VTDRGAMDNPAIGVVRLGFWRRLRAHCPRLRTPRTAKASTSPARSPVGVPRPSTALASAERRQSERFDPPPKQPRAMVLRDPVVRQIETKIRQLAGGLFGAYAGGLTETFSARGAEGISGGGLIYGQVLRTFADANFRRGASAALGAACPREIGLGQAAPQAPRSAQKRLRAFSAGLYEAGIQLLAQTFWSPSKRGVAALQKCPFQGSVQFPCPGFRRILGCTFIWRLTINHAAPAPEGTALAGGSRPLPHPKPARPAVPRGAIAPVAHCMPRPIP
jgi:hypothetical protein